MAGSFSPVRLQHYPLERDEVLALQAALLGWGGRHGRAFPWRRTREPYAVLVAEKLLQQTAATAGLVEAYRALVGRFPDAEALAAADLGEVQALVAPLGLHYRARELRALGRALVERHRGVAPGTLEELLALPGVGEYAARAVLSFCFDRDVAVVDTNVARWLHRLYGIASPLPPNPARSARLRRMAQELLPAGEARAFNLAVLDLCALVCVARVPRCGVCPIRVQCATGRGSTMTCNTQIGRLDTV